MRPARSPLSLALALALALPGALDAQPPRRHVAAFAAGVVGGLVLHESGHLAAGLAYNAHPGTRGVSYAGIPFFAVTHRHVPRRDEFVISSAGYWMQFANAEWILTRHPDLRAHPNSALEGILAFNLATSLVYTGAAVLHEGPAERDPRSMAASLGRNGWPEGAVGAIMLAPALLDAWRWWRPGHPAIAWASRGAKVGAVALTVAAGRK